MTVQLQGVGKRPAVKAADLEPGMTIMWNFGYTSTVIEVVPSKTGKSLTIRTESNGKTYTRKTTPDRLFAIVPDYRPFIAGCIIGEGDKQEMSVSDARETIKAWGAEGIEYPEGLTAGILSKVWNEILKGA